ncbi:MAG: hypothetical protein ACLQBQ_09585 [Smithella sp.]
MATPKKVDPVAGEGKQKDEGLKDIADFKFQPIPLKAARIAKPFDGYPLKKVKIGEADTYLSFVMALNPTVPVRLDPSNRKVKQKDGTFEQVKNTHARFIRDYEENENVEVVFDRIAEIGGKEYYCAIVPSHNVRAQLCYNYVDKNQRIEVDQRYLFLDTDQDQRLKRVFEQIINPKLRLEREASFIAGELQVDPGPPQQNLTEEEV